MGGDGDDVDDAPPIGHALGGLLRAPPLGLHVERELLVKLLDGDVGEGVHLAVEVAAGVVDHDVEAPEVLDHLVEHLGDGGEVHHVGGDAQPPLTPLLDLLGDGVHIVLTARHDGHVRAALSQRQGDPAADAAPAAGDHGHLAVESKQFVHAHDYPPWKKRKPSLMSGFGAIGEDVRVCQDGRRPAKLELT